MCSSATFLEAFWHTDRRGRLRHRARIPAGLCRLATARPSADHGLLQPESRDASESSRTLTQLRQVLAFQERFPREGLWWPYRGKAQFEKLVRNHLTQFLRQRGPTTPAAPPTRTGTRHACGSATAR